MSFWAEWVSWSRSFLLKQASLKIQQLKDDRRLCLALSLFDIMIQYSDHQEITEQLGFLFLDHYYKKEFAGIFKTI
jgi:hypothetical protein